MGERLAHRGPDDEGYPPTAGVGLGHRGSTILDTSPRGRQPMFSADGALAITFNGEIYNFLELRAELEARGHTLPHRTRHRGHPPPLQRVGRATASTQLNGMFAFAIWDRRARRAVPGPRPARR